MYCLCNTYCVLVYVVIPVHRQFFILAGLNEDLSRVFWLSLTCSGIYFPHQAKVSIETNVYVT